VPFLDHVDVSEVDSISSFHSLCVCTAGLGM
jgi:hypothetical protein